MMIETSYFFATRALEHRNIDTLAQANTAEKRDTIMTAKKTGTVTGRPKKMPPANAEKLIREMAATGHSVVGIASALHVDFSVLKRWREEFPALQAALDEGRERERLALHTVLYDAATKNGNITAAMFLLKARHGYREGDQGEQANHVSINFTLPGALPLASFTQESIPNAESVSFSAPLLERK